MPWCAFNELRYSESAVCVFGTRFVKVSEFYCGTAVSLIMRFATDTDKFDVKSVVIE